MKHNFLSLFCPRYNKNLHAVRQIERESGEMVLQTLAMLNQEKDPKRRFFSILLNKSWMEKKPVVISKETHSDRRKEKYSHKVAQIDRRKQNTSWWLLRWQSPAFTLIPYGQSCRHQHHLNKQYPQSNPSPSTAGHITQDKERIHTGGVCWQCDVSRRGHY